MELVRAVTGSDSLADFVDTMISGDCPSRVLGLYISLISGCAFRYKFADVSVVFPLSILIPEHRGSSLFQSDWNDVQRHFLKPVISLGMELNARKTVAKYLMIF
jgi:hypothetical protein